MTKTKIFHKNSLRIVNDFSKKYSLRNLFIIIFPRFSVDFQIFSKIDQKPTENFLKNNYSGFFFKNLFPSFYHSPNFSKNFITVFQFFSKIDQKPTENFLKNNYSGFFFKNLFPSFYRSPNFSKNFKTVMVNVRFQFW